MKQKAPGIVTKPTGEPAESRSRDAGKGENDAGASGSSGSSGAAASELVQFAAYCAKELLGSASGTDVFAAVWGRLAHLLSFTAFACFELHEDGKHLEPDAASGFAPDITARLAAELVPFLADGGASRTQIIDFSRDGGAIGALLSPFGFGCGAVTPLVTDGRTVGLLLLVGRARDPFASTEIAVIDVAAGCLAVLYDARRRRRQEARANAAKEEFITVLAHEIRNPLAPMRNALQIMRANDHHPSAVGRSAYAMIERQVERIACLADDLFDSNQVAYGRVELDKERVLLTGVIEQAATQARHWTEAGQHDVILDLPDEPVGVLGDRKRLTRVFSSLLSQIARHLGRRGRIKVSTELHGSQVTVLVHATAGESGAGLRELLSAAAGGAVLDGRSPAGFTASVALVRHFVEMHSGTMTARGNADGTVEFAVSLPVADPVSMRSATYVDPPGTSIGPRRILVADDNADSAESMGMLLRLMGNDVRIANDGLDAVNQASAFQPDVVLLDIAMPRLDGYEAARRIREQDWSRDTLIVAITGWGARDDGDRRALAAGFDRHFTKPIDPAELRKLLNEPAPRH